MLTCATPHRPELKVSPMAHAAKKVEHCGPKKGSGAYYGRKAVAKHESSKTRRRLAQQEVAAETASASNA
ncbi:MAG: hypothetical protein Q8J78_12410 [Moraxellaceae bacterium]|nr:hypothetical protein [Moraxellaceae bacterium]